MHEYTWTPGATTSGLVTIGVSSFSGNARLAPLLNEATSVFPRGSFSAAPTANALGALPGLLELPWFSLPMATMGSTL